MWIVSLVLLILLLLHYPRWRQKTTIKHWYNTLQLDKHHTNYQHLYERIDGFALSQQARAGCDAMEYTYGEIDFISFIALLSLTKPDINTVFYDLGSGTGKAVLACAMVFNVQKSCGIELFSELHHTALRQQHHLQQLPDYREAANAIHFINADFLHTDFSDATLIMVNATAFFGETWESLNQRLSQMKQGVTIITTSKKLSSKAFFVKKITTVRMSWGLVNAYIHQHVSCVNQ